MLKLFLASTVTNKELYLTEMSEENYIAFVPRGKKIIVCESPEEAKQMLDKWTKEYLQECRGKWIYPNLRIYWEEPREIPMEKGILLDDGIDWDHLFPSGVKALSVSEVV